MDRSMNRNRLPIIVVLVLSLAAAGFTRQLAALQRSRGVGAAHQTGAAKLGQMNSYALALLLGGLRGPLVMFLWPSAETQKQEKNLADFDTKIEWIRLLQAEFDTVHIFQIWNKAYNISVQMSNLGNKYRTILDALEYAHSVDVERPGNINILTAIGGIYFDKLAGSAEKAYYRERVRDESMARRDMVRVTLPADRREQLVKLSIDAGLPARKLRIYTDDRTGEIWANVSKGIADAIKDGLGPNAKYTDRPRQRIDRNDPTWRRTELDPILDAQGNVLPEYLAAKNPRRPGLDPSAEWNDGSELQYLRQYEPFPYGVSPYALGYSYYKRSQVLQTVGKQKHAQLSDSVIDSRPALALKNWSEEEWERASRAEVEAFGKPVTSSERRALQAPTALIKLDEPIVHRHPLNEAIFEYGRAAKLAQDSIAEYERHLKNDAINVSTYLSHIDEMRGAAAYCSGNHDYLLAMAEPARRQELARSAAEHYRAALRIYRTIVLTYYVTDGIVAQVYPKDVTRATIAQKNLSDEQLGSILASVRALLPPDLNQYESGEEMKEFLTYIDRAQARLNNLGT
jgi:hypothetical protein